MKKVGYFFFTFLAPIASIGLQFIAAFPVMGFCMLQICFATLASGGKTEYTKLLWQITSSVSSQNNAMLISIVYASFGILLFGIWYTKQFGGSLSFPSERFGNPQILLGIIFLVPGLQMISAVLTSFSASFFPGWMEFYEKLMENAGLTQSPSLLVFLYAVLLGPIAEEMTFRGVALSSAKKALPFWAANLLQALLFGAFHMNLIQGIYAFFIGLFLGYVCSRGGSIWLSVFLHILFNAWGAFVQIEIYSTISFFLFILLGFLGLFLFHKNTYASGVNHLDEFSDM